MTQTIDLHPIKGGPKLSQIKVDLPTLGVDEKVPVGCGVMRIINAKGDDRITWDKQNLTEINKAKDAFDELVAQGLVPYEVGTDGKATAEVMDEFNPAAEEVIFLPIQMVAGG